jgi:SAM-dependent methyltransferase
MNLKRSKMVFKVGEIGASLSFKGVIKFLLRWSPMNPLNLDLIKEIYRLWEPVYPYLAHHIHEAFGRKEGRILEIGPFCGVIFTLIKEGIGNSFSIAAFPSGMGDFFYLEAREKKIDKKLEIIETDPSLTGVEKNSFDLAIFRGAFFFPSLFKVNLSRIYRILRPAGIALIGGGFGKFTPDPIIKNIGKRSRDLNLQIGKIEINEVQLRQDIDKTHKKGKIEILSEGGLWVLIRKEPVLPEPMET